MSRWLEDEIMQYVGKPNDGPLPSTIFDLMMSLGYANVEGTLIQDFTIYSSAGKPVIVEQDICRATWNYRVAKGLISLKGRYLEELISRSRVETLRKILSTVRKKETTKNMVVSQLLDLSKDVGRIWKRSRSPSRMELRSRKSLKITLASGVRTDVPSVDIDL